MGNCILCQGWPRKRAKSNAGALLFSRVLQFKRIITTVFVTLTLAFQYLERRECEYDLKISIDFYKVLIIV